MHIGFQFFSVVIDIPMSQDELLTTTKTLFLKKVMDGDRYEGNLF